MTPLVQSRAVKDPYISLVVPALNEASNIQLFYDRCRAVLDSLSSQWEILFIDDGSTDSTLQLIADLADRDPRVGYIALARNFGSHAAIGAGLDHCRGDVVVILAADLQDPPEVIGQFLARWGEGHDVVWGARSTRADPRGRAAVARLFYGLVRRYALPTYPRSGTGSFCLLDGKVVDAIRRFPERNRTTFGLVSWTGFAQTEVPYDRAARHSGASKWGPGALIKTAVDTFVSFSYAPIRLISYAGIIFAALGFIAAICVVISRLVYGTQLAGWPSLMTAVLVLAGLQLLTLGVLGEYIWRIAEDAKQRPLYIVREASPADRRPPLRD